MAINQSTVASSRRSVLIRCPSQPRICNRQDFAYVVMVERHHYLEEQYMGGQQYGWVRCLELKAGFTVQLLLGE